MEVSLSTGFSPTEAVITRNSGNTNWVFNITQKSNVSISSLGFVGGSYDTGPFCIWASGNDMVAFDNLRFTDVFWGIKCGTYDPVIASRYSITNLYAYHCFRPLFLADITDFSVSDSTIDAVPWSETTSNQTHGLYIERNATYGYFTNVTWTRGSGYCLHLYAETAGNNGSHHIYFDTCTIDARNGKRSVYLDNEYSYIYFNDCYFPGQYENSSSAAIFRCALPTNIYMTGIEAHGMRLVYGGSGDGSISGDFYGEVIGAPATWNTSGLTHHYEDWDVTP